MGRYAVQAQRGEEKPRITLSDRHQPIPNTLWFSLAQARGLMKALEAAIAFVEQKDMLEWEVKE